MTRENFEINIQYLYGYFKRGCEKIGTKKMEYIWVL